MELLFLEATDALIGRRVMDGWERFEKYRA